MEVIYWAGLWVIVFQILSLSLDIQKDPLLFVVQMLVNIVSFNLFTSSVIVVSTLNFHPMGRGLIPCTST